MRATKQFSDAEYVNFVESYCHSRGWLWEFQSPQAPYPNVCDLAVFPAMSRRHSHLLAERTDSVASKDEIWAAAEKVWAELENHKIASGFILAWRNAKRIVDHHGDNCWLNTKDSHHDVRKDFIPAATGIRPRATLN